jgi:hypothetical protein
VKQMHRARALFLVAAFLHLSGCASGSQTPSREVRLSGEVAAFRQCIAAYRDRKEYMHRLRRDRASMIRAIDLLLREQSCVNEAGLKGLSIGDTECGSGFDLKAMYDPNPSDTVLRNRARPVGNSCV